MDKLKIKMLKKTDSKGGDYWFSTCRVPASVDLSNSVIHFFPCSSTNDNTSTDGELVIRRYDKSKSNDLD